MLLVCARFACVRSYVLALGNHWSIACHCAELILFNLLQRQVCLFILLSEVSVCSLCLCLILRFSFGDLLEHSLPLC